MPTERRSPWFNARTQPPVNGGDDALYEHRCSAASHGTDWRRPVLIKKGAVVHATCPRCQWRGLLRESDDGK